VLDLEKGAAFKNELNEQIKHLKQHIEDLGARYERKEELNKDYINTIA